MLFQFKGKVLALIATLLAHQAAAHGGCLNYTVGDTWYPGYSPYDDPIPQDTAPWMPQRKWVTNDPITSPLNTSLSCNAPGTPARASIPITAGQNITAVYMYWVHTVGPMIAWMAHCDNDDCSTFDSSTAEWFKIGQRGLESGTIELGTWFQKSFSRWDGGPSLWSERVPVGLRRGRYLVRHEVVSLHSANRPQFYAQCAHLDVGNEGVGRVPGREFLVRIPGVWSMDQPEINIDIYAPGVSNSTVYNIPGPPVWTG
ncbi:glycoside hydrolase family 61 protein-like protein [Byssothecium circinans]|uniref:AA9 family lytic polysaccharide monooxygenase n=1 Tax=Byssothecium circinans TaxID=147558 RepID=A0A6A5TTD2_9PLEO|nr:glycoside hydrolase family 61 protein-like protein [Byssothecium circinans]